MGEKLVVGPIGKGLKTNVLPFNIDNDSFPFLVNAYQWRARVKRKRGTSLLNRLTRFFNSLISSYNPGSTTIVLNGSGAGNLLTGFTALETNASLVMGSIIINDVTNGSVYTDPDKNGTLRKDGLVDLGSTINYITGAFVIAGGAGNTVNANFLYYPSFPVMGLEDLILDSTLFPGTIAFDTKYAYNILTTATYPSYSVSFYKNPVADPVNLPGYVPKATPTPVTWNGQDYQQFWTVNYQGAFWATNGINIPFTTANIGMQFTTVTGAAIGAGGPPAIVTLNTAGSPAVIGDFVFINEIVGMTGINFQTGYVTAVNPGVSITVEFPNATIGGAWASGGIIQYLTTRVDTTKDCIRWYDGDPTNGSATSPVLNGHFGWVNFMPPISQSAFSIADLPAKIYYLVGARLIVPFKDRLLFMGVVVQASSGNPIYLQDTIVYSQNGTPYYTTSFTDPSTNYPLSPTTPPGYASILLPVNQTATPSAYFSDITGFGGFLTAGTQQPIITSQFNEDVLITGFGNNLQARLVYSGNDIVPFNFFAINSEYGTSSTFSSVNTDQGVLTKGNRGYLITGQTACQRIDLEIPDQIFEVKLTDNGNERFTSQRDFINEWIYFTYPSNEQPWVFPNQTLQYNFRDNSWGIFNESYTTYGQFKKVTGDTWATIGDKYSTWEDWNDPWDAGESTLLQPEVIAGNQQGFVMLRETGTSEGTSLYIQSFSGNTITSPNHNLNEGDYIIISGCLGTIAPFVNNQIFSVANPDANTFRLNPLIGSGTYLGGGVITRMYVPYIQTKQFPLNWSTGRKTRIGVQQYLLSTTSLGQIQLLIFLSQNDAAAYNEGPILPDPSSVNDSLIYSTTLYTCPESTNLGLTPANINLNTPTASAQNQIWHRINTSLLGDTVQLGFTISNDQMRTLSPTATIFPITGATKANPCVLTCAGQFSVGTLILIQNVVGMVQLNNHIYYVTASDATTVTINVNSTSFDTYVSGGTATEVAPLIQFAEVELHGFILDVSPSQLLV